MDVTALRICRLIFYFRSFQQPPERKEPLPPKEELLTDMDKLDVQITKTEKEIEQRKERIRRAKLLESSGGLSVGPEPKTVRPDALSPMSYFPLPADCG